LRVSFVVPSGSRFSLDDLLHRLYGDRPVKDALHLALRFSVASQSLDEFKVTMPGHLSNALFDCSYFLPGRNARSLDYNWFHGATFAGAPLRL
jgi:hypothetical protein